MRRTGLSAIAVAALTVVIGSCSKTESTKPASSSQPAERTGAVGTGGAGANLKSDQDFVRDVAIKNMAQVELSRMALDKATNAEVRSFAQSVINEQGAATQTLKNIVAARSLEWPAELGDKYKEAAGELADKQGADFDRGYLEAMADGQQDFAAKLESRLDVQSLADWKTAAAGRTRSTALPEPKDALRDVQVRPIKSDNEVTMEINQWAADAYPVAQKQLDTARSLENATKKHSTD